LCFGKSLLVASYLVSPPKNNKIIAAVFVILRQYEKIWD
jgi:hypothetical protein